MSATIRTNGGRQTAQRSATPVRRIAPVLLLALLTGCGTTVQLLPESLDCPVLPDRLATACAAPQALPDGASFEQLIRASIQDRQALQVCEKRRADLAESVRVCNKAVADHLAKLRALNQASQAPR